ncbi:MAG: type II and III secretion system protein family protein [Syntrophobacteraceae bacterium]|nr:type II and III secretion system protein family protein [Syntrophobacteraceae bacterium]
MCNRLGLPTAKRREILVGLALVLVLYTGCRAAGVGVISGRGGKIDLVAGKSVVIKSAVPIIRVSSANESVATVAAISPNQVYVTAGKTPGVTNITLWQAQDKIVAIYNVEVSPDMSRVREKIRQVFPGERGLIVTAGNDSVTLAGTVSSAPVMSQICELAKQYCEGKPVINAARVSGIQQVMLEVRVAEMDRSLTKRLSLDFVTQTGGSIGTSVLGGLAGLTGGSSSPLSATVATTANSLFHIAGGAVSWTQFIDALKEDGLVKILAEPTLVAMSGQTAKFLAGGQFPVPVPQGLGTVGIEYKPYGVQLKFTPTVLDGGRISMKVAPDVSELDFNNAITIQGTTVPALTERGVETVLELGDGQSFAIAGLLQDNITETIAKFPGLGNLPVLGPLFRSSKFQRNQTELIVIVTPHLVKPLNMQNQPLPTDHYTEPSDTDFFLKGLLQGCQSATPPPICQPGDQGLDGQFGHALPR